MSQNKIPIVFTFNILRNVFRQFQTNHYNQVKQAFEAQNVNVELLPIITQEKDTIESRSQHIKSQFNKVLEKLQTNKVHLVAYSGSGLDCRYFITELQGNQFIESLTTIASPNRGSFLADQFVQGNAPQNLIEPVSRLIGMSSYSFTELNTDNIQSFNASVIGQETDIKYYSIGGERKPEHSLDMLRPTNQYIFENKDSIDLNQSSFESYRQQSGIPQDSDGVFSSDEIQWGTHLVNFEADHAELVGIGNKYFDCSKVYGLVSDNIKHNHSN